MVVVPHKKNIQGKNTTAEMSIADGNLSGNLLVVSEIDSELTTVAPTRSIYTICRGVSLKERECPAVPET